MEKQVSISGSELAALIRRSLSGIVPSEAISSYGSDNYETGETSFHMRVCFPSMEAMRGQEGECQA
ncbi:MAG: hypothetical protein AB7E30_03975 [Lawsonibacter sp.]